MLNSPDKATDPPPKEPEPPTKIDLKDQDGVPLGYQRFLLKLDDGSDMSGVTDKDGKAELDLKTGGQASFPDASEADSKGDMRPHVVRQGDYMQRLGHTLGFPDSALKDFGTAEQMTFKKQVYNAHVNATKRKFNSDLPDDQLGPVEGGHRMRTDAASTCVSLLAKARSDLLAAQSGGIMVRWYSGRKAAPGFGNHTNGIAVDFTTTQSGVRLGANTSQNKIWLDSWFHQWLVAHAASDFNFKPIATEAWHWEYKP